MLGIWGTYFKFGKWKGDRQLSKATARKASPFAEKRNKSPENSDPCIVYITLEK